uniref:Uncharacterized protein TCIL3000_11_12830 n=1 Tax=Trypanosoma congolense (strain IL3000) TaxID=1068625 RepID=G0V2B4_TRYCI|nr:unnamed protein product [Trypanosoma congolense IL3000]
MHTFTRLNKEEKNVKKRENTPSLPPNSNEQKDKFYSIGFIFPPFSPFFSFFLSHLSHFVHKNAANEHGIWFTCQLSPHFFFLSFFPSTCTIQSHPLRCQLHTSKHHPFNSGENIIRAARCCRDREGTKPSNTANALTAGGVYSLNPSSSTSLVSTAPPSPPQEPRLLAGEEAG